MSKKYPWPASKIGKDEMRRLFEAKRRTGKPITLLVRDAVRKTFEGEEGKEES